MKVHELIDQLSKIDGGLQVKIQIDYFTNNSKNISSIDSQLHYVYPEKDMVVLSGLSAKKQDGEL